MESAHEEEVDESSPITWGDAEATDRHGLSSGILCGCFVGKVRRC